MHSDIQAEILKLTDAKLRQWLEKGKEDRDENGAVFYRELSAAEMKCVLTRLEQLGIGAAAGTGSATDHLVSAAKKKIDGLRFQGRTLPQVSTDHDDSATGT